MPLLLAVFRHFAATPLAPIIIFADTLPAVFRLPMSRHYLLLRLFFATLRDAITPRRERRRASDAAARCRAMLLPAAVFRCLRFILPPAFTRQQRVTRDA